VAHEDSLVDEYKVKMSPGFIVTVEGPTIPTDGKFLFAETENTTAEMPLISKKFVKISDIV